MLAFTIEKTGDTAVLKIIEKMTRKRLYDLRETFMIFLGGVDHVIINISGLAEINSTCLQWLCSACNTILSLNKSVALVKDWPSTFNRAVMESGFACRKDCVFEGNGKCIFMEAEQRTFMSNHNENSIVRLY